jgi:hypothetical protein
LIIFIITFQKRKNKENSPKGGKSFLARRKLQILSKIFWIAGLLFLGVSCSKGDDAEAIRKLIDKGVALGEKHDIEELMKLATEDFIALPGDLDRRSTRAILWRAFNYYGALKIVHPWPSVEVEPNGKRASAGLPFLILREDRSFPKLKDFSHDPKRWLEEVGENADLYRLDMELAKENGRWLVRRAVLKRFTGWSFQE